MNPPGYGLFLEPPRRIISEQLHNRLLLEVLRKVRLIHVIKNYTYLCQIAAANYPTLLHFGLEFSPEIDALSLTLSDSATGLTFDIGEDINIEFAEDRLTPGWLLDGSLAPAISYCESVVRKLPDIERHIRISALAERLEMGSRKHGVSIAYESFKKGE